ncbi:unnamed protein product [Phyllotreta striolata]|uniref:Uncharacterized protein n=1 Tax=Phyllotreta striolata TaxID=444603 RepID=A0A9N9XSB9_PHYSR|nr:unnamed protein product [Phyllotreta striolata]
MLQNPLLRNMKIKQVITGQRSTPRLTNAFENFSYILYSHIAAKSLRLTLKPEHQKLAKARELSSIQIYTYANGRRGPVFEPLKVTPIDRKRI